MMPKRTLLVAHKMSPVLTKSVKYLRKCGYDVIETGSDKSCLQLIARHEPPLVLCNLMLPAATGCRCLEHLKPRGPNGQPFVVQFSDNWEAVDSLAVDEVLPLPVRPSELLPWVNMFFRFKEMETFHQSIIENISDAVFLTDHQGRITYVCPNVINIFGYTNLDVLDLGNVSSLISDELFTPDTLEAQGEIQNIEAVITRKDGGRRTVLINVKKVDMGEAARLYVCRDITQSVEYQQMKEQLQQAHKMEAIGTLAGGIAHEFNNILGIIIGNTELAADEIGSANLAQDFLAEIRTASRRAKDVVRKILSFARKTPYDPKPVRIGALIEEGIRFLRSTIPTTIKIHTSNQCRNETILADATEINQIMMNLLTNAAHAIADRLGEIDVSITSVQLNATAAARYKNLKPGGYVRLMVNDNGTGITAKDLPRIFDPYFTTKDVDQGTGMGLAIVYGIVKKHGGDIAVGSEVGRGTDVEVLLPLLADETKVALSDKDALPTGTESILVVDDEPAMIKMVGIVLERLGYNVATYSSAVRALAVVAESPDHFDLVITDMAMPEMAGDELSRNLKKIRNTLPVILCTGHSERIDEAGAKASGIDAFLYKPIEKDKLAQIIRQVIDGRVGGENT